MSRKTIYAAALAVAAPAAAQNGAHPVEPPTVAAQPAGAIKIDGVLDEPVWQTPAPATDFRQTDPHEGQPASQRTEVRFAVDGQALYVGARMHDSLGGRGVQPRLMRRDSDGAGDYLLLTFDTFHDHVGRTVFGVNALGVKYDAGQATSNADPSWDPVWEYQGRIDSLGWTAEIRIPLAQLRFPRDSVQTWGVQLTRYVERLNETSHWAFWGKQEAGGPNRYGHLTGLEITRRPRGYELMPYALARASYVEPTQPGSPFQAGSRHDMRVGADFRALLGSNLTLSATVNPDFGQVEVDPAVVNLSAFETFFSEKRPFFVEGSGQFGFGGFNCRFCSNVDGMSLFYSRRIGRRPQGLMPGDRQYTDIPENTSILGAAKVTGRLRNGLQVAVLDAVTAPEEGRAVLRDGTRISRETEPFTNYFVARLRRTTRGGNVTVGGIATSTLRAFGWDSLAYQLPRHAEAVGFDWNVFWKNRTYSLMGNVAFSNVSGDSLAIARIQTSSARYFQRPDREAHANGLFTHRYDRSLTSFRGFGGYARLGKDAGDWRWESMVNYRSPGFETNDLAFLARTDYVWMNGNVWRTFTRPTSWYRQARFVAGGQQQYNFDGDLTDRQLHGAFGFDFLNYAYAGLFGIFRPEVNEDRLTRGGPVVRRARSYFLNADAGTDSRARISANGYAGYGWNAEGIHAWETGANLRLRPASNVSVSLGPSFSRNGSRAQFVTRFADTTATHFFGQRAIFATITQRTLAMNTRVNWTFTPTLTLELFAQPFVASGQYSQFSEFARPRTVEKVPVDPARWSVVQDGEGRDSVYFYTFDPADPDSRRIALRNPDFNVRSLRGNAVLRWEWRPGSTLFFVWQQQRSQAQPYGDFDLTRDVPGVFGARPDNVFVVKATYWLGG